MAEDISKGLQNSLFPETESETVYEQPLNERIRSFLRLEHLFELVRINIAGESEFHSRAAISAMVDVTDLLLRTDIKAELIKELDRQAGILSGLRQNPRVDSRRLDETLGRLANVLTLIRTSGYQPGQALRTDELVTAIRQRIAIPGGTCNFDLPAFHYWLIQPAAQRRQKLDAWFDDLAALRDGVRLALAILRESASPSPESADKGFFQQTLDTSVSCQLIRIGLPPNSQCFPEISAGKHRFTIRFLEQASTEQRPAQTQETISFVLERCIF